MSAALRNQLLETARRMNASGINSGTAGNLSARLDDGMLITPSGMDYAAMQAADLVTVSAGGEWAEGCRPSSEWRFHRDIYRAFPEAQAIVHAHPVHCTALACLRRSIPAFHYTVAIAGGEDIRCAEYATFGTQQLSDHVLRALEGRRACLLANHGLVCHGADLPSALALAIEVENLARTYCQCLALGEPVLLDRDEMARVLEKFRDYHSGRAP
jgi:L-fuculose-phosphate aldolase